MTKRFLFLLICLAALLGACSGADDERSARSFEVTGFVEAPLDERNRLLIDHEDIPGYMPPMIMLFNVENPDQARSLEPGDQIRFTYRVEPTRSRIAAIEPTGERREPGRKATENDSSTTDLLERGESIPDFAFIDENGETVRLSDYRGSVVALTFVFTRCPVPEYCPAMMRNFGNADEMLEAGPPLAKPWKLVTISFDPEYDTPEIMKRYGEAFNYDPRTWDLLTSPTLEPIEAISARVGLKFAQRDGSYMHNLRTVVLDAQGQVFHIFTDETWSPRELADKLRAASEE